MNRICDLREMFDFVEELQSDANIKQAAIELAKGNDDDEFAEEMTKH